MELVSIKFDKPTWWQNRGRNNYMEAHGVEIWDNPCPQGYEYAQRDGCVALTPITSRGSSDSARICIAHSALPAVIEALVKVLPRVDQMKLAARINNNHESNLTWTEVDI